MEGTTVKQARPRLRAVAALVLGGCSLFLVPGMLTGQTVPPPIGNTFYGTVTQGGSSAAVGTTIHIAVDRQEYGTTQVVTDPGLGNIYSGNVNGPEGASATFRSTDYEFAQEGTISTTTLQRLDITSSA